MALIDPYESLERQLDWRLDPFLRLESRLSQRFGSDKPLPKYKSEAQLLRELGPPEVSGLGKMANLLNLPGSMAMDLISALTGTPRNPLDQLLHPLSHRERGESIGFRDVMTQLGARPNQETGLRGWKDPKEAALDLAGFAGDVAFDPLNLVTLGGGAVSKGGAVLRRAGAPKLSTLDRITTSVDDLAKRTNQDALKDAAKAAGFDDPAAFLTKHGQEKVGGLMGLGIPFKDNFATAGTGDVAQGIAKTWDTTKETLRHGKIPGTQFSPGQEIAAMFSHAAKGVRSPEMDPFAFDLTKTQDAIKLGLRTDTAARLAKALRSGHDPEQLSTLGRMHLEGVLDVEKVPEPFRQMATDAGDMVKGLKEHQKVVFLQAKHNGTRLEHLVDPTGGEYAARTFIEQMGGKLASSLSRETYMTGVFGMTEQLRRIIADPKLKEGSWEEGMQYLMSRWGEKFIPRQNEGHLFDELLHKIRDVWSPEQLKVGGYGQHVLKDAQDGFISSKFKIAQTDSVIESLAKLGKPTRDMKERGMSFYEVLERAGIESGHRNPGYDVIDDAAQPEVIALGRDAPKSVTGEPQKLLTGPQQTGLIPQPRLVKGLEEADATRMLQAKVKKPPKQDGALYRIQEQLAKLGRGLTTSPDDLNKIGHMQVPERIAEDIINHIARATPLHQTPGLVAQAWDTFTNAFKAGVLNWPASITRDSMSALAQLGLTGHFAPQATKEAAQLVGGGVADFRNIPAVARLMAKQGLPMTPEASTDAMRQLAYAHDLIGPGSGASGTAEVAGLGDLPGGAASFSKEFAGLDPVNLKRLSTLAAGSSWNPLKTRGVANQLTTEFKPFAMAERLRQAGDSYTRLTGFITDLRRGVDPGQAARTIKDVLVDYSPSTFTDTERTLRKALPFYAFSSRMAKHIGKELSEKPGRGLSQFIQAQHEAQATELPMPAYVGQTGAIPLGQLDDGTKRYLTSLGMMHEDPLSFAGGEGTSKLAELGSRLHPLLKMPIELATGESLFQRGPMGGRELSEADPPIGRLLTNLGLRDDLPGGRAKPLFGAAFEHVMANMPTARAVTTARTLSDPRKDLMDTRVPGPAALLNTLTGARISDVSPQSQDLAIIQRRDQLARENLGARSFTKSYVPAEDRELARRSGDRTLIEQMDAYNELGAYMDKKKKERQKAERLKARQQAWNQTAF